MFFKIGVVKSVFYKAPLVAASKTNLAINTYLEHEKRNIKNGMFSKESPELWLDLALVS